VAREDLKYNVDDAHNLPEAAQIINSNFDLCDQHESLTPSSTTKPHDISEVDETSIDTTKNKVVSNSLAKGWEDHKNSVVGSSTPHNIDQVDEDDTDATKNKLVSNALAKGWEDHRNTTSNNPHGVDFIELDDAPSDYTGQAGKAVVVKSTEDGLEFSSSTPDAHGNEAHSPDFLAADGSNSPTSDIDWGGKSIVNLLSAALDQLKRRVGGKYIEIPPQTLDDDFVYVAQLKLGKYLCLGKFGYGARGFITSNAILDYSSTGGVGSLGDGNYFVPENADGYGWVADFNYGSWYVQIGYINWGGSTDRKKWPDDFTIVFEGHYNQWKSYIPLNMGSNKITNLADPTAAQDAATKNYADGKLPLSTSSAIDAYMSGNKWLSVATSGIVGLPKQSFVLAHVNNGGADFSVNATTWTKVPFDAVDTDIQSEFDTTNKRFTVTEDGIYCSVAVVACKDMTDQNYYYLHLYKNGAAWGGRYRYTASGGSMQSMLSLVILPLTAGDYIEIYTYGQAGFTIAWGLYQSYWSIAKIA